MKQVILSANNNTVLAKHASIKKFYGVLVSGIAAAFVTRTDEEGFYTLRTLEGLTHGKGWDCYARKNLWECLEEAIKDGNEVFEFDTHEDLLCWMLTGETGE